MNPELVCPVCGGEGEILHQDGVHADTCYRCHGYGNVGGNWKKRKARRVLEKRWLNRLVRNNPDMPDTWVLSRVFGRMASDIFNNKSPLLDFLETSAKNDEEWPESEPMSWIAGDFTALTKTLRLFFGADVHVEFDGDDVHCFHIVDVRDEVLADFEKNRNKKDGNKE